MSNPKITMQFAADSAEELIELLAGFSLGSVSDAATRKPRAKVAAQPDAKQPATTVEETKPNAATSTSTTTAATPAPAAAPAAAGNETGVTLEKVRELVTKLSVAGKRDDIKKALATLGDFKGATDVSEKAPEKLPALYEELSKIKIG